MPAPAMPRGRVRKFNPKIPKHIDQAALPRGVYFNPAGSGHWYVLDGKKKRYVAGASAPLSELHRAVESGTSTPQSSLQALCDLFEASEAFTSLAKATRTDYAYCARTVCAFRMKDGSKFGLVPAKALSRPVLQRLIDALGRGTKPDPAGALIATPSKARHVARYLGVLTRWGGNRGHCPGGIGDKLELPKEKANARMPESSAHEAVVAFAKAHGALRRQQDAVAPYLWAVAEIAYLCRLRGVEVCDMTEARATEAGLLCLRRKGSAANVTEWTPRLRAAWLHLIGLRDATWARRKMPTPIRAEDRPLVTTLTGGPLPRRALTSAWRKMIVLAIKKGVLASEQRFGLHGLKHRGVTDTEGTRAQKREASGHATEAMVKRYDHSVPVVPAAGARLGKNPRETL